MILEKVILAKEIRDLMPKSKTNDSEFPAYYSVQFKERGSSYRVELDYHFFSFDGYHKFETFAEAFTGFYNAQAEEAHDFQPQSYQYEDDWMEANGVIAGLDTNKHYIYLHCKKSDSKSRQIIDEFVSILRHS